VPEEYSGKVVEMLNKRKGEMVKMEAKGDRVLLLFHIPARGIIGLRTHMLTATAGEAVMNHRYLKYVPYKGPIDTRQNGSLIAMEGGNAFAYALNKLQDRGIFFIPPGTPIYAGQVVGENNRADDLSINVTKSKKLSNVRASGSDDKVRIAPPKLFSLEEAIEYIRSDEYVEVTPKSIRMRKIYLNEHERKKEEKAIQHN
jgi:GTP-binding protein